MMMNNFNRDQLFLRTKFQGSKRQSCSEISEKWKNYVFKWRQASETGHYIKTGIFQNVFLMMMITFNHDKITKNQV